MYICVVELLAQSGDSSSQRDSHTRINRAAFVEGKHTEGVKMYVSNEDNQQYTITYTIIYDTTTAVVVQPRE